MIMSHSNTTELTKSINAFCQLMEAIGNNILDFKLSTCDISCETAIMWEFTDVKSVDTTMEQVSSGQMYDVTFTIENTNYTIHTERTDIIQLIIDYENIFTYCTITTTTDNEERIKLYTREPSQPLQLKIPKQ